MAVVYRARDAKLDELVALKLLRPEALASDPSLLERFKQEIPARSADHAQERPADHFRQGNSMPYISMEWTGSRSRTSSATAARCRSASGCRAPSRCATASAAAAVVHRDIKPQT